MYRSKILAMLIAVTCVLFFTSQFLKIELISRCSWALIVPMFTLLYFLNVKKKTLFFSLFLVCYAISDLLSFFELSMPYFILYFFGNSLYILAYTFLIFEICKSLRLRPVIRNYKMHIAVLSALNIYIIYVLQIIINPYIVDSEEYVPEYFVELIYNIVMLLVLSLSLINYFYMDNKKALLLFIASLCIVFSEVFNIAYLYVTETNMLNSISSALAILAFFFYYQQSGLENERAKGLVI